MRYADVSEAGFSAEGVERAHTYWERRGAAAFLAVYRGAVVAAWGDVGRRFPAASMRKSFLSALYGVFRDDIDLTRTLAELGIGDVPPLTAEERRARVIDLIRSRSGVYHAAAAEPVEMSDTRPERGSHPPGTYWWYNNWDFNAAGTVFEQLTGRTIAGAFESAIATPIGMRDFRPMDAFDHYERERSIHPAYVFRMSTRDLARFGLLYARRGRWGSEQVVPAGWIAESTRAHSEVDLGEEYGTGFGYMWWVEESGAFAARGYGGHVLMVDPARDLVMVVRADTDHDRFVSDRAIAILFARFAAAGGGTPVADPRLVPLASGASDDTAFAMPATERARYTGTYALPSGRTVMVASAGDALTIDYGLGVFRLMPESDTRFRLEDVGDPVAFELGSDGRASAVWSEQIAYLEAQSAIHAGSIDAAVNHVRTAVETFPRSARARYNLARALSGIGETDEALEQLRTALRIEPGYREASLLRRRLQLRRFAWPAVALVALALIFLIVRRRRLR